MQTLRIFISSPGDVADERQISGKVIERLQGKYWSFVRLDDVFWEKKVIRSTAHYQDELIQPSECEIVFGILWSRLGSPLPGKFQEDADVAVTGTQWELENAFSAHSRNYESLLSSGKTEREANHLAKPHIVVYRRKAGRNPMADPAAESAAAAQERLLDGYISHQFHNSDQDHTIKRPITQYTTLDEFEAILSSNLEEIILRMIPALERGFEPPPISGSPFKGLRVFEFADSDRYYGRNREIREIQKRLGNSAAQGLPFILIYGGSGYGKSSLMHAGLSPVIVRPGGSIDGIEGWRRVSFQPSKGRGSLVERFAAALLATAEEDERQSKLHRYWPLTGIPALRQPNPLGATLWDAAQIARDLDGDASRADVIGAIATVLSNMGRHLLLTIDQMEEIFTDPAIGTAARSSFLRTIADLCLTGRVWVVCTMRSEFFFRIAEQPELVELVGKDRGYILPPPDQQALREMIRYPALASRLNFERRITASEVELNEVWHESLDDQILADASASPDALPLLEFTLEELYKQRDGSLLTWRSYLGIGGLAGAIAMSAGEVYARLSPSAKESRHRIFAALIHIDPFRHTVTRRRASLVSLESSPSAQNFIREFLSAHLFITDEDGASGQPTITLAHEALLSHWSELEHWISDHRGDLLARQRLAEAAEIWAQAASSEKKDHLLSAARLGEAERVSASTLFNLTDSEADFLHLSRKASLRRLRFFQSATTLFALLAISAAILGGMARSSRNQAVAAEKKTKEQLFLTRRQMERSVFNEGKGWLERARTAAGNKDSLLAAALAGKAVGFRGYGWQEGDAGAWGERFPSLLGEPFVTDPDLETRRLAVVGEVESFIKSIKSPVLPLWSSPLSKHHRGPVTTLDFSRDGKLMATGSTDLLVKIWNLADGKQTAEIGGFKKAISEVAFSPDGKLLAVATSDGKVGIWSSNEWNLVSSIPAQEDGQAIVKFSPDGKSLATVGAHGGVSIWKVGEGKEISRLAKPVESISYVEFSPDGSLLAAAAGKLVFIWSLGGNQEPVVLTGHDLGVKCLRFSPDGRRLASGGFDSEVRIWDAVKGGTPLALLSGHEESVESVCFSPDGLIVASASHTTYDHISEDRTMRFWNAKTGEELLSSFHHRNSVWSMAFTQDGKRLAAACNDGIVRFWEVSARKDLAAPATDKSGVKELSFSPDGKRLSTVTGSGAVVTMDAATLGGISELAPNPGERRKCSVMSPNGVWLAHGYSDGKIKLLNLSEDTPPKTLSGHLDNVYCLTFDADGQTLASGSTDGSIRLWDVAHGTETAVLEGHEDTILTLDFNNDGTLLASGGIDSKIKIWDPAQRREIATLTGHSQHVKKVTFNGDGTLLASYSHDKTVRIWDLASRKEFVSWSSLGHLPEDLEFSPDGRHIAFATGQGFQLMDINTTYEAAMVPVKGGVSNIAFDPGGTHLAGVLDDGSVAMWDAASEVPVDLRTGHLDEVGCTAFSPDGKFIASASDDSTIKLWDAHSGAEVATLRGHSGAVNAIRFSLDGTQIASASADNTVKLWSLALRRQIATFRGHEDSVNCVEFHPDGNKLASGSKDGSVIFWSLDSGEEIGKLDSYADSLSFNPAGDRLAIGSGRIITIWDLEGMAEAVRLEGHEESVHSVAFGPDGLQLASGSDDYTVRLWDIAAGSHAILGKHAGKVKCVAFSSDGDRLASASEIYESGGSGESHRIKIWKLGENREIAAFAGHARTVRSVCFSPDGNTLVSGSADDTLRLWNLAGPSEFITLNGHRNDITGATFSHDRRVAATSSKGGDIRVWDVQTGRTLAELKQISDGVVSLALNSEGSRLAAGTSSLVEVWDTSTGAKSRLFMEEASGLPISLAFLPRQNHLVIGIHATLEVKVVNVDDFKTVPQSTPPAFPYSSLYPGFDFDISGSSLKLMLSEKREPDLFSFQRDGQVVLEEGDLEWPETNTFVSTSRTFTRFHSSNSATSTDADTKRAIVTRFENLARGNAWRAAIALRQQLEAAGQSPLDDLQARRNYLICLASSRDPDPAHRRFDAIVSGLDRQIMENPGTSLLISSFVKSEIRNAAGTEEPQFRSLAEALLQTASLPWLEIVMETASNTEDAVALKRIAVLAREFAVRYPESEIFNRLQLSPQFESPDN